MANGKKHGAKKVKKTMGAIWKGVRRDIAAGRRPEEEDAQELISLLDAYGPYVDSTWEKEWTSCRQALEKCLNHAGKGNASEASDLLDAIDGMEKNCHRLYKD